MKLNNSFTFSNISYPNKMSTAGFVRPHFLLFCIRHWDYFPPKVTKLTFQINWKNLIFLFAYTISRAAIRNATWNTILDLILGLQGCIWWKDISQKGFEFNEPTLSQSAKTRLSVKFHVDLHWWDLQWVLWVFLIEDPLPISTLILAC